MELMLSSNALSADSRIVFADFKSPANENWYAWVKFDCTFSNPNCSLILFQIISPCFFRSFSISSPAWLIWLLIGSISWSASASTDMVQIKEPFQVTNFTRNTLTSRPKYRENNDSIFCYSKNEYRVAKFIFKDFYCFLDRLPYPFSDFKNL